MTMLPSLLMIGAAMGGGQVQSPRRGDQMRAFEARRQGRLLPLPEIEARVVPTMRGAQYIGFDFDSDTAIYTLKFLRNGSVIWVEVDGRSGQIVGRTGR
ncbi:hypothetical protein [Sphingomonas bacterium]|uniref:hypothetical protein n=1 Tax=Sphingomonas bacterium TaxID=1895847 RepID=UPI0015765846|nr:hypothetical protein [Sphingomonas bacterium]